MMGQNIRTLALLAVSGVSTLLLLNGCGGGSSGTNHLTPISNIVSMNIIIPPNLDTTDSNLITAYVLNNSQAPISGASFQVMWADIESTEGNYSFANLDAKLAPWITAGKKVNLIFWSVSDGESATCSNSGFNGSYNCALPAYVWGLLGLSNSTFCSTQYGPNPQQVPNYFSTVFQARYQAFLSAVIAHYRSNASIGYIRFGLGHGGESNPGVGYNSTSNCGTAFTAWAGGTDSSTSAWVTGYWEPYLQTMVQYEASLKSPVQLMVGTTPFGTPADLSPDYLAPLAANLGIGFGSQGLEISDVQNYPNCGGNWCNLFSTWTGKVPLELQTIYQSCAPGATCTTEEQQTGSLTDLLPFAVQQHATILEIYYQDWLTAYDPDYTPYSSRYASVFASAANGQ
jgi:hypothetical protein